MPLEFNIDAAARARLAKLGFDIASLPHQYCSSCDLCGWTVFRTISHVDRYAFVRTYQMCEGCGLVFQNPHPTAEGYAEFYAKWYRPLVSALTGAEEDRRAIQSAPKTYAVKLMRFLKQRINPGAVKSAVDLGGSTGDVAQAVQETFGANCLVVDPSPKELDEARKLSLECEQALAEQWDPEGASLRLGANLSVG